MQKGEKMNELKSCPFCGASMKLRDGTYPSGSRRIEPDGWHDDNCPLYYVFWCFDVEDDGWTPESVTESWNRRINDAN